MPDEDFNDFRAHRQALGLTLEELAHLVPCSRMALSLVERGMSTSGEIRPRLAKLLLDLERAK
jgi:transcriptional regulator with XRE-family HTH domain